LSPPQINGRICAIPRSQEGRFAIVTNVGRGMQWTHRARLTRAREADGQNAWSWFLDAGIKPAMMLIHRAGDGDKKARSPGRARNKPLKPFARGMPGETGVTVVTMLVCFFQPHTRLRAHQTPGIPCALGFLRDVLQQQPGRVSAAGK
jgi:hypothetical protein